MAMTVQEVVAAARDLTPAQRRELIARIWPGPISTENETWVSIRFGEGMRVVAYVPEQEPFVDELRETLRGGVLARVENPTDGNYEIYGAERTFYVTMTPKREFAALLSSWPVGKSNQVIKLEENAYDECD